MTDWRSNDQGTGLLEVSSYSSRMQPPGSIPESFIGSSLPDAPGGPSAADLKDPDRHVVRPRSHRRAVRGHQRHGDLDPADFPRELIVFRYIRWNIIIIQPIFHELLHIGPRVQVLPGTFHVRRRPEGDPRPVVGHRHEEVLVEVATRIQRKQRSSITQADLERPAPPILQQEAHADIRHARVRPELRPQSVERAATLRRPTRGARTHIGRPLGGSGPGENRSGPHGNNPG